MGITRVMHGARKEYTGFWLDYLKKTRRSGDVGIVGMRWQIGGHGSDLSGSGC